MIFGCPTSEMGDCQSVPQNSGSAAVTKFSRMGASLFGLAMVLQIPVGYEDETGFHCGVPKWEMPPVVLEQENIFPTPL